VKRTALKRSAPLRRTTRIRQRSTSRYRTRERDFAYMGWVKQQPCAARHLGPCSGAIEADHAGRRGLGQKAGDETCVALCQLHHRHRTDHTGVFKAWTRDRMREWLSFQVGLHQARYRFDTGAEAAP
jgi:hypothetical protein